ncbi:hypothetical protein QYM36_003783 [Artemia franciscana]|nr:hypothetical protein QYM36_003783 [Artemia franciscana]
MIPVILKLFHEHLAIGIHASFERTLWKVRKFCIFENMASTIKEFVNNCDLCNRANTKKIKPPLGENIVPEMPFLVWALDGGGPFPITSSGNRYVLVGVDLFSSLVVLKCIPAMNTENTIKFLWENIISYYGLPEAVLSDHGSNFDNIEIKKMFSEINCKKIYSSPYNPQCNGASENNFVSFLWSKQAIQYNKDSKVTLIASGDIVYCRDTTSIGRKSTNYSFRGPYVVLSEVHNNVFYLASLNPEYQRGGFADRTEVVDLLPGSQTVNCKRFAIELRSIHEEADIRVALHTGFCTRTGSYKTTPNELVCLQDKVNSITKLAKRLPPSLVDSIAFLHS